MDRTVFALLVLTLSTCATEEPGDAAAECNVLVDRICNKAVECLAQRQPATTTAQRQQAVDACKSQFHTELDCSRAVDVKDSYQTCLSQVTSSSCAVFINANGKAQLPASCTGVILLPRS